MENDLLTDYELLELIHEDNKEAYSNLFFRYDNMIGCVAKPLLRKWGNCEDIRDDIRSQARFAYIGVVNGYNIEKGSFFNYWYNVIYKSLLAECRTIFKNRNLQLIDSFSEDQDGTVVVIPTSSLDIKEEYSKMEISNKIMEIINQNFDELERKVFNLKIEDYSYKDMEMILNISIKKVDNIMEKIRKKVKSQINYY